MAHRLEDWAELAQHAGRVAIRALEDNGPALRHALEVGEPLGGAAQAAAIGIGVAGTVLGGSEIYQGVRSLRQGDKLHGSLSLIGGSSTLVGAACMLTQGLAPAFYASSPLGAVGTVGSGVGAIFDGVEDLIPDAEGERHTLLGLSKMASGGVMVAAGLTGLPALQGIGSTMYIGCLYGQYHDPIENWVKDKLEPFKQGPWR